MIKVTANGETVEYDEAKMLGAEVMAVETVTGMTIAEWADGLTKGSGTAMLAMVWVAFKRKDTALTFAAVKEWDFAAMNVEQVAAEPDGAPGEGDDDAVPFGSNELTPPVEESSTSTSAIPE